MLDYVKPLLGKGSCKFIGNFSTEEDHIHVDEHNQLSVSLEKGNFEILEYYFLGEMWGCTFIWSAQD